MRKPIVSRRIVTTAVRAAVKTGGVVDGQTFIIAGLPGTDQQILNKVRKLNPGVEIIGVISHETKSLLYGMELEEFIKFGHILDPKTRKPEEV